MIITIKKRPNVTLGQKSTFYPKIHIFANPYFYKIHILEISFFTKFTFYQNQGIFWIKRSGVLPQCAQGSFLNGDFRTSSFAFWYATYRVAFKKRGNHEETCCILRSARFFKNQLVLEERSLKNGSSSRKCVIFLSVFSRGRKLHYYASNHYSRYTYLGGGAGKFNVYMQEKLPLFSSPQPKLNLDEAVHENNVLAPRSSTFDMHAHLF